MAPRTKKKPAVVQVQVEPRAVARTHRDLPITGMPSWDNVGAVKSALLQLENGGQFANVSLLFDAMLSDDRIAGVLSQRFDGLLGLPMEMRPPEDLEEDARALEIAEAAKVDFPKMANESTLRSLLRWGRGVGIGLGEKLWDISGERWIPKLKVWHPRHVYWQWTDRLFHVVAEGGVLPLNVGPYGPETQVDPQWLLYAPFGYGRDAWINSLVRPLAIPWLIRQWAYRDWARYSEVHGLPIRKGVVPATAKEEDKERFLQELTSLASESVVRLPDGGDGNRFDLQLVEAVGNTWEGFEKLLSKCEASIAIAIVGQNLTTEVKGGSLAASKVHDQVRGDILASDALTLGATLRDGLLRDWCERNYGDPDLAPWPSWNTDPPEDMGQQATTLKTFAEGLTAARATQVPIDVAELCERFNVPLVEGAEIPEYEPPPPPAPFGDSPGREPKPGEGELSLLSRKGERAAVRAQVYTDEVADHGRAEAAKVLGVDVRALRAIVNESESYDDMRSRLVAAYKHMDPSKMARLLERCLSMASLAGRHAVEEEAGE